MGSFLISTYDPSFYMKRISILAVLICALSLPCSGQRVLFSSGDIKQPYGGPAIKKVYRILRFSPNITVKYVDGSVEKVPIKSIWGYQDRRGRYFRIYKGDSYRIRDTTGIIRYSIMLPAGHGVANYSYYSQNLDSRLYWTRSKASRDTL